MPKKDTKKKVTKPKVVKLKKKAVPKKAAPKKAVQTKITPAQQFTNTYHVNIQTENLPPVYYTMPTIQTPVPTMTEPKPVKVSKSIATNTESDPRYFDSIATNTDTRYFDSIATNTDPPTVRGFGTNTEPKPRRVYATTSTNTETDPILTELPVRVNVKRKRATTIRKEGPPQKKRQYVQEIWDHEPTHFTMGTSTTMGPDEIPVPVRRIVTNKRKRKGPTASIGTNTGIEPELSGNTDPSFFSFDNPMRRQY